MNPDDDAFAEALNNEFQEAGYAIRSVGAGPGTIPLSFQVESANQIQTSRTVTVTVGNVGVRREYVANADGKISPVGAMFVQNADADSLQLNDEIFATLDSEDDSSETPDSSWMEIAPNQQIASSGVSLPVPADAAVNELQPRSQPSANLSAALPLNSTIAAPSIARSQSSEAFTTLAEKGTRNILDLEQSNFESVFSEMGIVNEKVLTFSADSTRVDDASKARLLELMQNFDPARDIFSVTGCSLGPTEHSGGQEFLARGRAERVKEELIFAGVPSSQILAEGCWAEETFDERMPRSGAVVTLKRPIT